MIQVIMDDIWKYFFNDTYNSFTNPYRNPKDQYWRYQPQNPKTRTSLLSQIADINRMVSALLSNNLPKSQIVEEVLVAKDSEEEGLRVTVIVERVVNGETRRYRVAVEELGDEEESDDEDVPEENTSYFTE
tara:strand:+ start:1328 stop:1720 length:393 start_codon:yes stop_codon:yes gene_type:complete